jgi:hypothetical protein
MNVELLNKIGVIIGIIGMACIGAILIGFIIYMLYMKIEKAYDRRKIKTAVKDWLDQKPTNQFEAELCKEVVIEKLKDLNTLDFSNEILVEKYTDLIIQGTTLYQMECEDHKRIVKESWNKVFGNSNEN